MAIKKAKACCSVLLFFLLALILTWHPAKVSAVTPPEMNVESLNGSDTYTNTDVVVSGWAINSSGVASILINITQGYHVVSQTIQSSSMTNRADVRAAYPTYANSLQSGFSAIFSKDTIPAGNNTVTVTIKGNDGTSETFTKGIIINKSQQLMNVDSYNYGYLASSFTINGWSLNTSGINKVYATIDGNPNGNSTYTVRSDVNKTYPAYASTNPKSGFTITCTPDLSSLSNSKHTVVVTAVGNDGSVTSIPLTMTKAQPEMNAESLNSTSTVNSNLTVTGWAVNGSGVDKVTVTVSQGAYSITQTINSSAMTKRSDVQSAYPFYPNSLSSGFSCTFPKNALPYGSIAVTVTVYGNDGSTESYEKSLNVNKLPPQMNIESLGSVSSFNNTDISVAGWAINESGVNSIVVTAAQGSHTITKTITGSSMTRRGDVQNAYPAYTGSLNSGFSCTLSKDSIPIGANIITVKVIGNDGSSQTFTKSITMNKPAQLMTIDSAHNGYITSDFTVSGWALNMDGINQVYATIDGNIVGTATFTTRSDVNRAYPSYTANNPTAGYTIECKPDLSKYTIGKHTLVVTVVGNDGSVTTNSVQMNKAAPMMSGEGVSAGQSFPYDGNINLYGWAVNASGVNNVKIYVDGTNNLIQTISPLNARSDINHAINNDGNGGYYDVTDHSGFSGITINLSSLSFGKSHTIIIVATGNDGTTQTGTIPFYISNESFTDFHITLSQLTTDINNLYGKTNYISSSSLDPNTIKNSSSSGIYQFMSLHWVDGVTVDELNNMLKNCGVLTGQGATFLQAAKEYDINPVYLVAHARIESGNGTSHLATGYGLDSNGNYVFNGYYNEFGIAAYDATPMNGNTAAQKYGWNSVAKAINGGAQWIHKHYIGGYEDHGGYDQNTLYEMKWDPYGFATSGHGYEYATDLDWASSIAGLINQYDSTFTGVTFKFIIPTYN